ncbi:MAG: hypothetical protein ACOYOP_07695 [Microthrixaceae bacterium]
MSARPASARAVVGAAAVAVLWCLAATVTACGEGGPTAGRASSSTTTTSTVAALTDRVVDSGDPVADAALEGVAARVEELRGLRFRRPVTARVLPEPQFLERLDATIERDRAEVAAAGDLLVLTGELPPGTDFVAASRAGELADVLGFYDPATRELVVGGDPASPFARAVAAHELTHALDDQWAEGVEPVDEDARVALAATAEGSADRVLEAYLAGMDVRERAAARAGEVGTDRGIDLSGVPPEMWEGLEDLYSLGDAFVARVVRRGGRSALDGVQRRADLATAEVLHGPPAPGGLAPVPAPAADGPVLAAGVLGELGLLGMLNSAVEPAAARSAAAVWRGDWWVRWATPGGGQCLRLDVRPAAVGADGAIATLQRWAAAGPGRTVARRDDLVRVESCR